MSITKKYFDICIVGGGIIGAAAACGLKLSPYLSHKRIALVESGNLFQELTLIDNVFANRTVSLRPSSKAFLQQLRVWDKIPQDRKRDYFDIKVWDSCADGSIEFSSSNAVATIVENRILQSILAQFARDLDIHVYNETKVDDILENNNLILSDGTNLSCNLLVGADGPNSKVRTFANISSDGLDYGQMGLVGTIKIQECTNLTAWQRFLPTGTLALLPLADNYSSIVWSLGSKQAQSVAKLAPKDFCVLINAALHNPVEDTLFLLSQIDENGNTLCDFSEEAEWGRKRGLKSMINPPIVLDIEEDSRACFPLKLRHASTYISNGVALIGDAAHTIHPLAGQGLNLGLADVESFVNCISEAARDGQDIGNILALKQYNSDRYADNAAMLLACDVLNRIFSNDYQALASVRSLGLNALNSFPPAKAAIMKLAS